MSGVENDGFNGTPPPSFRGSLKQFIYSSSSTTGTTLSPAPLQAPSPKRKRDEVPGDADSTTTALQSSKSTPTLTTTTAAARTIETRASVRLTRSRSSQAQQTVLSACRSTRTRTRLRNTTSSNGSTSTSDNAEDDLPSLATVAKTGLSRLRDTIPPGLILLFVGVNPGIMTGQTGFVYAHPSNLYWRLLHSSGITTHRHPPSDTYRLPELYAVGNTNIVARATRDASQLSRAEMDAGVPVLEEKIAKNRPEAVCLVGKSIWEAVWRVRKGRNIKKEEFKYGWQDESENMGRVLAPGSVSSSSGGAVEGSGGGGWNGARVFVATTTSGLAASMSLAEKQAIWKELGDWVKQRRAERGIPEPSLSEAWGISNP
ncbi:hypothetical protein VTO42DRAFT_231 [Malbranchea cinnamomea]